MSPKCLLEPTHVIGASFGFFGLLGSHVCDADSSKDHVMHLSDLKKMQLCIITILILLATGTVDFRPATVS